MLADAGLPRCFGASGRDCLALQIDDNVPNKCADDHLGAAPIDFSLIGANGLEVQSWSSCVADPHYRPRGAQQFQAVTVGSLRHDQVCEDAESTPYCAATGVDFSAFLSLRNNFFQSLFPAGCNAYADEVIEYVSCVDSEDQCEFYAQLNAPDTQSEEERQSCGDVCGRRGGTCLAAYDNETYLAPNCDRKDAVNLGCDAALNDLICVCTPPSSNRDTSAEGAPELLRAVRDATQDGRSWSVPFEIAEEANYRLLDAEQSLTPEAASLAAPFGVDVRNADDAKYCRSGEVDERLLPVGNDLESMHLCQPYYERLAAGTEPAPEIPTSCGFLDADDNWVAEGFSFTYPQLWTEVSLFATAYDELVGAPGPLQPNVTGSYLETQQYMEAALEATAETGVSCGQRRVMAVRDGNGDIAGVAVIRNHPHAAEGDLGRTHFAGVLEAFATRADVYAPELVDCLRAELGLSLMNLLRIQPNDRTEGFWQNEAIRVEADRINDGGYTHAWNNGPVVYLEGTCGYLEGGTSPSQLTLFGQDDENLIYLEPGGQNFIHIPKRFEAGRSLMDQQILGSTLGREFGWPMVVPELPTRPTCARTPVYEQSSREVGDLFSGDDSLDSFPASNSSCLSPVEPHDDGYEEEAPEDPNFLAALEALANEPLPNLANPELIDSQRCRALRSVGEMYSAVERPVLSDTNTAINGSGLWDFRVGLFEDKSIRVLTTRRALVGPSSGKRWAGTPGLLSSFSDTGPDGEVTTYELEDAIANTLAQLDIWWETLGGEDAYDQCGHCEPLSDLVPLDWETRGIPDATIEDSYVSPQPSPQAVWPFGSTPSFEVGTSVEYLDDYIEGLHKADNPRFQRLRHRGFGWVDSSGIRAVGHAKVVLADGELPRSEIWMLVADNPVNARALGRCMLDELQGDSGMLLTLQARPAPLRQSFWQDFATEELAKRPELAPCYPDEPVVCFEASCSVLDDQVSVVGPSLVIINEGRDSMALE